MPNFLMSLLNGEIPMAFQYQTDYKLKLNSSLTGVDND